MALVQDDDVIQAFSPDRSDDSFGAGVLPWRSWRGQDFADVHGSQAIAEGDSIGAIAIPDEVFRGAVPWKRFRDLPRQPSRRGVLRYVEMNQPSPGVTKHDECIEQPERGGRDDKQVDRSEARRMVRKESPPGLRRWARVAHHVSGHRRLGDVDAELEKLTVDTWCSPERVLPAHPAYQVSNL